MANKHLERCSTSVIMNDLIFLNVFSPASDWQESSLDEDAGKQALIGCQYECKLIKRFEGQFGSELEL